MFWADIWKILEFFPSENFQFLVVKFSIYLNRCVFIMNGTDEAFLLVYFSRPSLLASSLSFCCGTCYVSTFDEHTVFRCWCIKCSKISLNLALLNPEYPAFANSDPDQLASEKANWSGSVLFAIKYMIFLQQLGWSILIGWKLEVGMAS